MQHAMLIFVVLVAQLSLPSLSPQQRESLGRAVDGKDHREEAFAALLEYVRGWSESIGDAPIRVNPNYAALRDDPARFRGELCRVSGTVEQVTTLPPPYATVHECFVRTADGLPVLVYVAGPESAPRLAAKQRIEIDAMFYKRVEFVARDGKHHGYPAFVGAFPR